MYLYFPHITFEVLNNHKEKKWSLRFVKGRLKSIWETIFSCCFLRWALTFILLFPSMILLFFFFLFYIYFISILISLSVALLAPFFDFSLFLLLTWYLFHFSSNIFVCRFACTLIWSVIVCLISFLVYLLILHLFLCLSAYSLVVSFLTCFSYLLGHF
jgi:hypothetical protein